jgi:hypothetical protein
MMADREARPRNPGGASPEEFDRDLNLRGIVWTGVGLAAVTALAFVLMWFLFQGLAASQEARDPEPLPMPEAAERAQPPGPALQSTPERDLAEMLAHEKTLLESYGLVDREGGYARIPIERAMALALERGLGLGAEESGEAPPAEANDGGSDAP